MLYSLVLTYMCVSNVDPVYIKFGIEGSANSLVQIIDMEQQIIWDLESRKDDPSIYKECTVIDSKIRENF